VSLYVASFHLAEEPFRLTPDPRFLYPGGQYRRALEELAFGITSRKGFLVLTGEAGTGKTTLCRALLDRLGTEVRTALVLNPALSAEELVRAVVRDFAIPGAEDPALSKARLLDLLNTFLLRAALEGGNALLVVDEAQRLAPEVMEEIRLLGNLETEREKLLNVLLVGQTELVSMLERDDLRQLRQRVAVRTHLSPLSPREVGEYVGHRLAVAGGGRAATVFAPGALSRVARASRGIPRTVNLICDRALLAAFGAGAARVTRRTAARAAAEVRHGSGDSPRRPSARAWRRFALAGLVALAALLFPAVAWRGQEGEEKAGMRPAATNASAVPALAPSPAAEGIVSRALARIGAEEAAREAAGWNLRLAEVDALERALLALNLAGRFAVYSVRMPWDEDAWRAAGIAGMVAIAGGGFAILRPGEAEGTWMLEGASGEEELSGTRLTERLVLEEALVLYSAGEGHAPLLSPGVRGAEVISLQQRLARAGFDPGGGIDGVFGPGTVRSLISFQRRWRLPATGAIDGRTWLLLTRLGKGGEG
jgi:general secretion pathway protein A